MYLVASLHSTLNKVFNETKLKKYPLTKGERIMKNYIKIAAVAILAMHVAPAYSASLSSVTCTDDLVTFNFSGVAGTTNITMEASQSGSGWSIIGAGELDGSNSSPSIGVPTNLSEFTDIISNKNTASYRAVIDGTTTTASCS